jgi:hypothetical protein
MSSKRSFKEKMDELKVRLSIILKKVFTFMDSSLRVQVGTDLRRD